MRVNPNWATKCFTPSTWAHQLSTWRRLRNRQTCSHDEWLEELITRERSRDKRYKEQIKSESSRDSGMWQHWLLWLHLGTHYLGTLCRLHLVTHHVGTHRLLWALERPPPRLSTTQRSEGRLWAWQKQPRPSKGCAQRACPHENTVRTNTNRNVGYIKKRAVLDEPVRMTPLSGQTQTGKSDTQ